MDQQKLIAGLIFMAMGVFFIFFRLKIAKGAAEFYRKAYTEKNLKVIFLIVGIVLALVGALLILQYIS